MMKRLLILTMSVCLMLAAQGTRLARAGRAWQTTATNPTGTEQSAQVDALINPLVQPQTPGIAVLVVQDGRVVHSKGYGLARLETREPIKPNTAFDLASTSKQFTAMALMILAERGRLSYDDQLSKFFPEFPPYAQSITLRHLLNHTSGLVDAINPSLFREGYEPTSKDLVKLMTQEKSVRFAPGEKFEYNNAGYVLLSVIVEKVSGQPFARFMRENVFKPLGMKHTFIFDETKPKVEGMAISYFYKDNAFQPYKLTSDIFLYGAKGVISTIEDMYKWDQALETGKLVKASTLKQALTPAKLSNGGETRYGFGWAIGRDNGVEVFGHAGGYLGYRSAIMRYPSKATTVILLSNNAQVEATSLARKIARIYLAPRTTAPAALKLDEAILKEYVGKYEGDPSVMQNLIIEITLEAGELYITSPIKPKTRLVAQSPVEFQIEGTGSSLVFNRDVKGYIASLTLKTNRAVFNARKM